MIPQHLIDLYGTRQEDLIGKFYNCIFDEAARRYDIKNPHKHKVINAWWIRHKGYIWGGICYETENGRRVSGCDRKHFSDT